MGAVVRWGLTQNTWHTLNLDAIGLIAMVVGVIGLVASTLVWAPWRSSTTVVDEPVERVRVNH